VAERLIEAHGSRWRRVWTLAEREPALAERIVPALPYTGAEMRYAVEHELACTLADLLVRRTHLAFEQRDAGRAAARTVAALVAPQLGWTDAMQRAQLASYDREAERMFRIGE
jgi:glycerol-3-phosphate dehydrogenase